MGKAKAKAKFSTNSILKKNKFNKDNFLKKTCEENTVAKQKHVRKTLQ